MGLNALVILSEGHAFAGFWLQPQEFAQLVTDDVSSVRKRVDLKEMVVFETTLVTKAQPPSFTQAFEEALKHLTEEEFHAAIDTRRARMQKIRPLALGSTRLESRLDSEPNVRHGFEDAPVLPSFELDIEMEGTKDAAGRLVQWQRKLLDLTTRNRLLHLPDSAKSIRLICANPGYLEDKLAEGKRIRIVSLPDLELGGVMRNYIASKQMQTSGRSMPNRLWSVVKLYHLSKKNAWNHHLLICIESQKATWKKGEPIPCFLQLVS